MFNQLKEAFEGFIKVFQELPMGKKVALSVASAMMLVGILATAWLSSGTDYTVLYSNLNQEDTLAITQKLKEKNILYKLEGAGKVISVPQMDVYQLRLELAGEGLPSGGGVGFEIFDQSTFGMTEFVQNLNYRRALQGELQRTINSMGTIKSSRVHIVIPKRTLFEEDSQKASASVVLELRGNNSLPQTQVDSISHLVASSVEGLDPNQITIVDTRGNLLSVPEDGDEVARLSVKQLEYQKMYESDIEKRIRTMLERVVGFGRAVVRVNADIDFRQVQRTEEIYDPASQVARSEQRTEEKSNGTSLPSGVAGVNSNIPGVTENEAVFSKPATSNRTNETINYEINKTIQTVVEPTSTVKKLSVAVLVDGKYTRKEDGTREFAPLTAQETGRLDNLVRSAIGFDPNRQDAVTIESIQFDVAPVDETAEAGGAMSNAEFITTLVQYAGLGIVALVIFLFVMRPLLGWVTTSASEVDELKTFPKTVRAMEEELANISKGPEIKLDFRQKVSELIANNPEQAANLVRAWLRTRG